MELNASRPEHGSDDVTPVGTWTRTLNADDAALLLDLAEPEMTLDAWTELGHSRLPQAGRPRRVELIRLVRDDLLDHDGTVITNSRFLRLFQDGSPHRRNGLLSGRLLARRPLVALALDSLVHPALERADEPLAPDDADHIQPTEWDAFLDRVLPANTGEAAFKKTRSTLQRALGEAGVLEVMGNTRRLTRVRHAEPEPLAFGWLVAHEMLARGRTEATIPWAIRESFAARLFAPAIHYAQSCLDTAIAAELLERSYLAGETRLYPGEMS